MRIRHKHLIFILAAVLAISLLPGLAFANSEWQEPGNSDLNILNGGVMLSDGEDLYFNHDGIFVQKGERVIALSADDGINLNLAGAYLYYTVGDTVCRIPSQGGGRELVHTAAGDIKQLYVVGDTLRYIAEGTAYKADIGGSAQKISGLSDIMGFIPTEYGDLFLKGEVLDYTLYAGDIAVLSGIQSCYTDSGYLAVQIDNQNYMVELSALFHGFDKSMLQDFHIHGNVSLMTLLDPDDENIISEYNDNNDLMCDFNALLEAAGLLDSGTVRLMADGGDTGETVVPPVSQGQLNMVKRARQLHEIEWTPLENRTQWGNRGTFYAERTYTGIPYGQPVNSNGYVGYGVSIETFVSSVLDNTSKFYTTYSNYNKIAPVFSTDCSGYVSYAWGLTQRRTTYTIPNIAEKVGDQSVYSLQIGDCLDKTTSHVVLISGLTYDTDGKIIGVEVMEQTPVITKLTRYGSGESRSLASFQSYYLNGGYEIYRYPQRDGVTYTPSAVVPLDGEAVAGQKDKAPKSTTTSFLGGKTVALKSDSGAPVYYTLDGSVPTTSSMRYTEPITFNDTAKLRAIAVSGAYSESTILEYTVKIPQLDAPAVEVTSGSSSGQYIASGSKVSLKSISGAAIYYTSDGTEPTTSSSIYSSPITVTGDITIKSMAVAKGYKQSSVSTVSYRLGTLYTITASAGANGSISPSGSTGVVQTGSKTFTITPASGFIVSDVLVDGASMGAVSSYTFSNVGANHTISASFKSSATIPFTDVSPNAWYYDAISYVYASSLFKGTTTTQFSPDMNMTRGMFTTVLGRFAGVTESYNGSTIGVVTGEGVNIRSGPSTDTEVAGFVTNRYTVVEVIGQSSNWYQIKYGAVTGYIRNDLMKAYSGNYSDLSSGNYYSVFAQWACLTGIADGVAGSSFNGESSITREDMCLMLYNYANVYGKKLPADLARATFSDDAQISGGAKTAVYALQQAGVINGMGNNQFSPKGSGTRAQVAQIFSKFSDVVK